MLAGLAILSLPPVAGQSGGRPITISWDASSSADVAGYRVYYGISHGQYLRQIDVGNQTTVDVPNLIEGTTYFFVVTAYTSAGDESDPSGELRYRQGQSPALFLNMSTRAKVESGDAVMISEFIIGGGSRKRVVIRALGPSLETAGVAGVLADPAIELFGSNGLIAANDNWRDGNPEELYQLQFAPAYATEAALVVTLLPGVYTVTVRGIHDASGIARLEVYDGGMPVVP